MVTLKGPLQGRLEGLGPQWTIGVSWHLSAEEEHGVRTGYVENGSVHSGQERALQRGPTAPDREEPLEHAND